MARNETRQLSKNERTRTRTRRAALSGREDNGTSVPTGEGAEQTTLSACEEGQPMIRSGRQIGGLRRIFHTGSRDFSSRRQDRRKTKRLAVAARGRRQKRPLTGIGPSGAAEDTRRVGNQPDRKATRKVGERKENPVLWGPHTDPKTPTIQANGQRETE